MQLSTNKKKIYFLFFIFASLSYSLLLSHYQQIVKHQTIVYIFYKRISFYIYIIFQSFEFHCKDHFTEYLDTGVYRCTVSK